MTSDSGLYSAGAVAALEDIRVGASDCVFGREEERKTGAMRGTERASNMPSTHRPLKERTNDTL